MRCLEKNYQNRIRAAGTLEVVAAQLDAHQMQFLQTKAAGSACCFVLALLVSYLIYSG
jgi:hypothetical protein